MAQQTFEPQRTQTASTGWSDSGGSYPFGVVHIISKDPDWDSSNPPGTVNGTVDVEALHTRSQPRRWNRKPAKPCKKSFQEREVHTNPNQFQSPTVWVLPILNGLDASQNLVGSPLAGRRGTQFPAQALNSDEREAKES